MDKKPKAGSRVRVFAPGHAHDDQEGEIVRVFEGEMPHVEVKQPGPKADAKHVKHHVPFEEVQKLHSDTKLVQGSAGAFFAEVLFSDGLVYTYALEQLEAV